MNGLSPRALSVTPLLRRDRIDAEIARVNAGKVATLDAKRAVEPAREVIQLADELAEEFRRVRDDFEQLNRDFRERIIDDDGERGDLLDRLFEGVDVTGESEAGAACNRHCDSERSRLVVRFNDYWLCFPGGLPAGISMTHGRT